MKYIAGNGVVRGWWLLKRGCWAACARITQDVMPPFVYDLVQVDWFVAVNNNAVNNDAVVALPGCSDRRLATLCMA